MLILTLFLFSTSHTVSSLLTNLDPQPVSAKMRTKLDSEEQSAICCQNSLQCCRRFESSPFFEVKAIITSCPNQCALNATNSKKKVVVKNKTMTNEKLTNCIQKLLLTIKMTNRGIASDKSQYIIIDHITDPKTMKKVGILNPYAVRIRQEPILQLYKLDFERVVNGEAREKICDRHTRGYRGCNVGPKNPTCGVISHGGTMVPYSTGFCCTCDKEEDEDDEEEHWNYPYHIGTGQKVYGHQQKRKADSKRADGKADVRKRQHRGGQNCDDFDINSLPRSFYESTHCLEFSDLWYAVYRFGKPRFVHKIKVQIFQKYEDCHGNTHWMDLTRGKMIDLGTEKTSCSIKDLNIIARYKGDDPEVCPAAIDYHKKKLLVPEKHVGDPGQFMLVPKKYVAPDGKTCDTAGVGYEAFYKQKKRCFKPQGSCLKNQPLHFEQEDMEAEANGKTGQYFLRYYGIFTENPITYNGKGQLDTLHMYFIKKHVSTLYFELNADLVTLLQANSFATITEVYTDATDTKKTRIIVKVTNSGLLYGVYYVRLSGCPMDVPASFNNIASKSVLIPAQHQHIYNLYIEYPLPVNELICSIHVHNVNQELKARREIRIRAKDRCICIWHCECACYVTDGGLKCTPMALEAYHEAGFQGGLPLPTQLVEPSYLDEALALFLNMLAILFLTLLVMGLLKALLGLCCRSISLWGLDTILGTDDEDDGSSGKIICQNKDCEYRDEGISRSAQFCLNVVFFFLYPLALMNICLRKMCFPSYTIEVDDGSCHCSDNSEEIFCQDESCPAGRQHMMESTDYDTDKSYENKSSKEDEARSNKRSENSANRAKVVTQTTDEEEDDIEYEEEHDPRAHHPQGRRGDMPPALPPVDKNDKDKDKKEK